MKQRPKAPKKYTHDGDDLNTRTKYKTEYTLNDSLKVILLQLYDINKFEGLQLAELKALVNCLVDQHFIEVDEIEEKPYAKFHPARD